MSELTQDQRLISIKTPLAEHELLLTSIDGVERISDLFEFQLETLSSNHSIRPEQLIGKTVTVTIQNEQRRTFNGYVRRFIYGEVKADNLRVYRLIVVPWLWFLSKTNNYRIFQNKTTKDIVCEVFKNLGFNDFDFKAEGNPKPREYCAQCNESDLDFVSRLLEEDGIAYFFRQTGDSHTLVLVDEKNTFPECAETNLEYSKGNQPKTQINRWEHGYEFRTGKWALNDYAYEYPSKSQLQTTVSMSGFANARNYEHYEYLHYYDFAGLNELTRKRIEAEEASLNVIAGASDCSSFYAGGKFRLAKHAVAAEQGSYLITSIRHRASESSYLAGHEKQSGYTNEFSCIPDSVHFRPPLVHQKPIMRGPQSAIVVGSAGEEIYVDKQGRIKVQFIWDREGRRDENSTCFIRVMQPWAGAGWGSSFVPRVGMEVIVQFLGGDPDRPIIAGSVYNGDNRPPFESKTQSGIRTNSSKGGGGWNELRFDDLKGSEEIYLQAQRNYRRLVKHDEEAEIQADQRQSIKMNRHVTVSEGNEVIEIKSGDRSLVVKKTDSVIADKIELAGNTSIVFRVGGSTIKMDAAGVTIKGTKVSINGTLLEAKGSGMVTLKGGVTKIN